jgi:hypothetical protein
MNARNQVCFRLRCGLLIAVAITMWISAVPIFAASTSDMTRPMADIQAGLGKLLDCHWLGNDLDAMCPIKQIAGTLDLYRDPVGKSVESVEMTALVARHPKPRPDEEKLSRDTVLRIVAYLLPTWKNSSEWLTDVLHAAARGRARKIIKIGGVTVLVQCVQPADLEDAFATIVITKKASLDDWKWDGDC